MSVTFRMDVPRVHVRPEDFRCKLCGGRPVAPLGCDACYDSGTDWTAYDAADRAANPHELNLSNANARAILAEIFDVHEDDLWGEMDAWQAQMRLSTFIDPGKLVSAPTEGQGHSIVLDGEVLWSKPGAHWLDCGRTSRQVASYVERFGKLIDAAVEAGVKITWG